MLLAPEAKLMPAPVTKDTLELEPFNEKLVAAGTVGPTIVMLLAPVFRVMFAPATSDTLEDVPWREKFVAAGTVGPTMVMLLAPELRVTFAPATKLTLDDVPLRVKPPPPPDVPMIVIFGLVEFCDKVMLLPATRAKAVEDAVLTVPDVAPPAADVIELRTVWLPIN
jgi:hypothetical protein